MTRENQDFKKRPGTKTLEKIAREIRIEVLKMLACAGSGHTAGAFSLGELFVGLYFFKFKFDTPGPIFPTPAKIFPFLN